MVASTTHTATSIFTSMLRPEATSMVSIVSMMPPTQQEAALVRRDFGCLASEMADGEVFACRSQLPRGFWDRVGALPSPWAKDERGSDRSRVLASVLPYASFSQVRGRAKRVLLQRL